MTTDSGTARGRWEMFDQILEPGYSAAIRVGLLLAGCAAATSDVYHLTHAFYQAVVEDTFHPIAGRPFYVNRNWLPRDILRARLGRLSRFNLLIRVATQIA